MQSLSVSQAHFSFAKFRNRRTKGRSSFLDRLSMKVVSILEQLKWQVETLSSMPAPLLLKRLEDLPRELKLLPPPQVVRKSKLAMLGLHVDRIHRKFLLR